MRNYLDVINNNLFESQEQELDEKMFGSFGKMKDNAKALFGNKSSKEAVAARKRGELIWKNWKKVYGSKPVELEKVIAALKKYEIQDDVLKVALKHMGYTHTK